MTHIVEMRKDPRPAGTAPEAGPPHTRPLPSTRIPPCVLEALGLKSEAPCPEKA